MAFAHDHVSRAENIFQRKKSSREMTNGQFRCNFSLLNVTPITQKYLCQLGGVPNTCQCFTHILSDPVLILMHANFKYAFTNSQQLAPAFICLRATLRMTEPASLAQESPECQESYTLGVPLSPCLICVRIFKYSRCLALLRTILRHVIQCLQRLHVGLSQGCPLSEFASCHTFSQSSSVSLLHSQLDLPGNAS